MGTRENFSENYQKFGHVLSKQFSSPALGAKTRIEPNLEHDPLDLLISSCMVVENGK
jgi:hypothetical protein